MPRTVPRAFVYEMLHCASEALRPRASNSRRHQERAKKPRSSSWRSGSTTSTPGSGVSAKVIVSEDARGGHGHDEGAALLEIGALLADDLVGDVPGQDDGVLRHLAQQRLRLAHGQPRARREQSLLVR